MKKALVLCIVLLILSFGTGVFADVGIYDWDISRECDYDRYVATVDGGVNLRTEPSTDGTILCTVPDFVKLHITAESTNGWGSTTYNGSYGWVALSQLSSAYPASDTNRTVIVSASDGVNLREGPDVSYAMVRSAIPVGEVLTVTSIYSKKNWGYVSYNGDSGWIALSEVSDYDAAAAAAAEQPQEEAAAEEVTEDLEEGGDTDVILLDPDEERDRNSSFLYIVIALIAIAVVITAAILLIVLLNKSTKKKM